jgi:TatA/E family protein of Tat protein translocase
MRAVFGSLGFTEIAFIFLLALLLFGPKKLPEIGKTLGKGLSEFRRASNELKRTLESEVADLSESERGARRPAAPLAPVPPAAPVVPAAAAPPPAPEAAPPPAAGAAEADARPPR